MNLVSPLQYRIGRSITLVPFVGPIKSTVFIPSIHDRIDIVLSVSIWVYTVYYNLGLSVLAHLGLLCPYTIWDYSTLLLRHNMPAIVFHLNLQSGRPRTRWFCPLDHIDRVANISRCIGDL